jgi:CBS domain-containing protein
MRLWWTKPAAGPRDEGRTRDILAYVVLGVCAVGLSAASVVAIWFAEKSEQAETTRFVFAAIVPLFGTWVGTVLAYYFAGKNLEAATKSTADLSKVTARLAGTFEADAATPVRDRMIARANMKVLKLKANGKLEDVRLKQLWNNFSGFGRLPVLSADEKIVAVVHRSLLERWAARQQGTVPNVFNTKTVADLGPDERELFSLFATVRQEATVADARTAMTAKGHGCSDVIVTEDGTTATPVVGWLTDTDLAGTPDTRPK